MTMMRETTEMGMKDNLASGMVLTDAGQLMTCITNRGRNSCDRNMEIEMNTNGREVEVGLQDRVVTVENETVETKGEKVMRTEVYGRADLGMSRRVFPMMENCDEMVKEWEERSEMEKSSPGGEKWLFIESNEYTPRKSWGKQKKNVQKRIKEWDAELEAVIRRFSTRTKEKRFEKDCRVFNNALKKLRQSLNNTLLNSSDLHQLAKVAVNHKLTMKERQNLIVSLYTEISKNRNWTYRGNTFYIEKKLDSAIFRKLKAKKEKPVLPAVKPIKPGNIVDVNKEGDIRIQILSHAEYEVFENTTNIQVNIKKMTVEGHVIEENRDNGSEWLRVGIDMVKEFVKMNLRVTREMVAA